MHAQALAPLDTGRIRSTAAGSERAGLVQTGNGISVYVPAGGGSIAPSAETRDDGTLDPHTDGSGHLLRIRTAVGEIGNPDPRREPVRSREDAEATGELFIHVPTGSVEPGHHIHVVREAQIISVEETFLFVPAEIAGEGLNQEVDPGC
jgi:hypothetical protein